MRHLVCAYTPQALVGPAGEDLDPAPGLARYYLDVHGHRASPSLVAATLANGTIAAGFSSGRDRALRLAFADSCEEPALQLQGAGDAISWALTLERRGNLAVTLAWPAARGRRSALSVSLDDGAAGVWRSSDEGAAGNSLHVLRVVGAAAGRYRLEVTAGKLQQAPQPFALVVTGPIAELALA